MAGVSGLSGLSAGVTCLVLVGVLFGCGEPAPLGEEPRDDAAWRDGAGPPDWYEDWDSVEEGGDGFNTFTSGAFYPNNAPGLVDGTRCQYSDPKNPDSASYGSPQGDPTVCRPSEANDWHVHSAAQAPVPKTFSGDGALYMGTYQETVAGFLPTYNTAQLSYAASPVIAIGLAGATLSFWHIVSLADDRFWNVSPGTSADRAVVQVAIVDPDTGDVLEPWHTITAFENGYNNEAFNRYFNCSFDPTDDGSTEDDLDTLPGEYPPLGPSSTCAPGLSYSNVGHWTSTYPLDVGEVEGPEGRKGALGDGIWVRSSFDLRAYAGQSIRVRFVVSGLRIGEPQTWMSLLYSAWGLLHDERMAGWIIDDFQVKQEK